MRRSLRSPAFIVSLLLLAGATAGLHAAIGALGIYLKKLPIEADRTMVQVPTETASWKQVGKDHREDPDVEKTLGTVNYVTRMYIEKSPADGKAPRLLEVHLPYYTGTVDTVPHVAERCMVGGGWQISTGSKVLPVVLDESAWRRAEPGDPEHPYLTSARLPNGAYSSAPGVEVHLPFELICGSTQDGQRRNTVDLRITDFVEPNSGARVFVGYFFIANGRLASSAEQVRTLAFDLKADYAYYLKIQVSSPQARTAEDLADTAGSLLSELMPEIMRCVPDWVEVEQRKRGGGSAAPTKGQP
jgi:hypothetical protein